MSQIKKEPIFQSEAIKIVRLGVPAGGAVPEHHSNVDVIATIVRGEGTFTVEGQPRAVRAGDVVTMRPRERHAIAADSDLEIVVVHARVASNGEPPACGA
jgi:quercetin dioxygenase-like cupin family protein